MSALTSLLAVLAALACLLLHPRSDLHGQIGETSRWI
jgi:hypothetical protein